MQSGHDTTSKKQAEDQISGNEPDVQAVLAEDESSSDSHTTQASSSDSGWQYTSDETGPQDELKPITWSASEYLDHDKPASWFLGVMGLAFLLSGVVYLLTRDVINSVVIILVAGLFAASGARRPRTLEYVVDSRGIHMGPRFYSYNDFKSFAIMEEGAINSIQLLQFKRFTTPINLYFPPDQEEEIVNFIGSYLPHENRRHDPIDKLMRKVRF